MTTQCQKLDDGKCRHQGAAKNKKTLFCPDLCLPRPGDVKIETWSVRRTDERAGTGWGERVPGIGNNTTYAKTAGAIKILAASLELEAVNEPGCQVWSGGVEK